MEIALQTPKPNNALAKSVALPIEHGAWGFLFEPLAAGVLLAPSMAAPWIVLMVVGAFLLRQPLKFLIPDWMAGKNLPRTSLAKKFALIYAAIFGAGAIGTAAFVSWQNLVPFLAIAPFAIYQIYCDAARSSRELLPELTGAVALSSSVAVLALAGGWDATDALILWAIMPARLIPSILYVRSRLRLEKGKPAKIFPAVAANFLALAFGAALVYYKLSSVLVFLMLALLFGRAAFGLSRLRRPAKAKTVGIYEVVYGSLMVSALVLGHYYG